MLPVVDSNIIRNNKRLHAHGSQGDHLLAYPLGCIFLMMAAFQVNKYPGILFWNPMLLLTVLCGASVSLPFPAHITVQILASMFLCLRPPAAEVL